MADIDPALLQQITNAGETGMVEAVILVARPKETSAIEDERGPGGALVDRVVAKLQEKPEEIRFMPKLGAFYIRAGGKLMREILAQPEVVSATTSDL